jgi:hypothetical protein
MATGLSSGGGIFSETDVRGAGDVEWATMSGIDPRNPLVSSGDPEGLPRDPGYRMVSLPDAQAGPATGGVAATPDAAPAVAQLDSWHDILNFRGSPMPWLLIGSLLILFFVHFKLEARARVGKASGHVGAAIA